MFSQEEQLGVVLIHSDNFSLIATLNKTPFFSQTSRILVKISLNKWLNDCVNTSSLFFTPAGSESDLSYDVNS